MSEKRIGIDLEAADLATYSTLVQGVRELLDHLSERVAGERVSWSAESAEVSVSAAPNGASEDALETIVRSAQAGLASYVDADGKAVDWPAEFDDAAKKAIEKIIRLLKRVPSMTVAIDNEEPLILESSPGLHARRSTEPAESSSVDGTLDMISVRALIPQFTITEFGTGQRVRCYISSPEHLAKAKECLGLRVVVEGAVRFTPKGAPRIISEVSDVFLRPCDGGSLSDLIGALPNMTGGVPSGEFVRQLREGEGDEEG